MYKRSPPNSGNKGLHPGSTHAVLPKRLSLGDTKICPSMPDARTGADSQIRQCLFCRYYRTDRNRLHKNIARYHCDTKQCITVNHRHGTKSQRTSRSARPQTRPCQMHFIVLWFLCWKIHFYNRFYYVQQRYIVWKTSCLTGTLASKIWILSVIKKHFSKNLIGKRRFYWDAVS